MVEFLSEAWVDAFNAALAGVTPPSPDPAAGLAAREGSWTLGQVVTGGPDGDVGTVLEVSPTGVHLRRTDATGAEAADVTVRLSWEDASAMAAGQLQPAEALTAGRVRVRGDLSILAAGQRVLAELQPRLQELSVAGAPPGKGHGDDATP